MRSKIVFATTVGLLLFGSGAAYALAPPADVTGSFVVADIPPPRPEPPPPNPVPEKPDRVVPPKPAPKLPMADSVSPFRGIAVAAGILGALSIGAWWWRGRGVRA